MSQVVEPVQAVIMRVRVEKEGKAGGRWVKQHGLAGWLEWWMDGWLAELVTMEGIRQD